MEQWHICICSVPLCLELHTIFYFSLFFFTGVLWNTFGLLPKAKEMITKLTSLVSLKMAILLKCYLYWSYTMYHVFINQPKYIKYNVAKLYLYLLWFFQFTKPRICLPQKSQKGKVYRCNSNSNSLYVFCCVCM